LLLQRPCHPDRLREGRNARTQAQRDGTNCPESGEPPRDAMRRAKPGKGRIRGEAGGRQRLLWAAEHGGNSNTPRVERSAIYGKMPRSTGRRAHPATCLFAHWAPRAARARTGRRTANPDRNPILAGISRPYDGNRSTQDRPAYRH
jgi:hypothetical protein